MTIPQGKHDPGCQCWPHYSQAEIDALTEDRDAWREIAMALADLHHAVAKNIIEQKITVKLDGDSIRSSLHRAVLTYDKRNPQVRWTRPLYEEPITS